MKSIISTVNSFFFQRYFENSRSQVTNFEHRGVCEQNPEVRLQVQSQACGPQLFHCCRLQKIQESEEQRKSSSTQTQALPL